MKKIAVLLLIMLLFVQGTAFAAQDTVGSFSYGNVRFGMSVKEVVDVLPVYSNLYIIDENVLCDAGWSTLNYYVFSGAELVSISGLFTEKHDDAMEYIRDFYDYDAGWTEKYGRPKIAQYYYWIDDDYYKGDSDLYGEAILDGSLFIMSKWENEGYTIIHTLEGKGDGEQAIHSATFEITSQQ